MLTIFNWVGIVLSVPLAVLLAALLTPPADSQALGIAFGVVAFVASLGWAAFFYRRVDAPGLTLNERLKRLGQAALIGAYPSYVGIAVAAITGSPAASLPFAAMAGLNVVALKRLAERVMVA